MSSFALESFLFKLSNDVSTQQTFLSSPHEVLMGFALSEEEVDDVLLWDVRSMVNRGVSPLLAVWAFTTLAPGPAGQQEYLRRMKSGASGFLPVVGGNANG